MLNLLREYGQLCEMIGFANAKNDLDDIEKYTKEANAIYDVLRKRLNDAAMTILNLLIKE